MSGGPTRFLTSRFDYSKMHNAEATRHIHMRYEGQALQHTSKRPAKPSVPIRVQVLRKALIWMLTLMLSLTSAAMDFPASISRGWWSDSSRCCELAADHLRSWQAPSQAVLTCGQGTCAGTADGLAEASARRLQDELACRKPRLSACPSCQKTLLSWHFTTSQEMRFTSPAGSQRLSHFQHRAFEGWQDQQPLACPRAHFGGGLARLCHDMRQRC